MSNSETFIKSIGAGVFIGIGCIVYTTCPIKLPGALLFSLGLLSVIMLKQNLYTGKVGYLLTEFNTTKEFLLNVAKLTEIFVGNFVGIYLTAIAWTASRHYSVIDVSARVNDTIPSLFVLGILCGILMFTAVEAYSRYSNPIIVILCVTVFIVAGFEHSIADMFYLICSDATVGQSLKVIGCVALGNAVGGVIAHMVSKYNYITGVLK